jgi:hypothetical protein
MLFSWLTNRRRAWGAWVRGDGCQGSEQVARFFAGRASAAHVTLINGDVGIIVVPHDQLLLAVVPRFENGRITHLHAIATPDDLAYGVVGRALTIRLYWRRL